MRRSVTPVADCGERYGVVAAAVVSVVASDESDCKKSLTNAPMPLGSPSQPQTDASGFDPLVVVLDEVEESFKGFRPKWHFFAAAPQDTAIQVECKLVERVLADGPVPGICLSAAHPSLSSAAS